MTISSATPEERVRAEAVLAALERCLAPASESLEEWMNRAVYGRSMGAYVPKALTASDEGWD